MSKEREFLFFNFNIIILDLALGLAIMDGKEVAPHGNAIEDVTNEYLLKTLREEIKGKTLLKQLDVVTRKLINSPISLEYVTKECLVNEGRSDLNSDVCVEMRENYNSRQGTRSVPVMENVKRNVPTMIIVSLVFFYSFMCLLHAVSKHILHQSTQYTFYPYFYLLINMNSFLNKPTTKTYFIVQTSRTKIYYFAEPAPLPSDKFFAEIIIGFTRVLTLPSEKLNFIELIYPDSEIMKHLYISASLCKHFLSRSDCLFLFVSLSPSFTLL